MCQKINDDLILLCNWFAENKLKLNVTKTQCMIIANSKQKIERIKNNNVYCKIKLDNVELEYVNSVKYLGIQIDRELNFDEHIQHMAKKISKKLGYLSRISKHLSMWARQIIYKTIVAPHFEYCSTLFWGMSAKNLNKLQRLQNWAMRIILALPKRSHVSEMLNTLQWMTIEQRIGLRVLIFIHNIERKSFNVDFKEFMFKNSDVHNHNTRSSNKYHIVRQNKTSSQKSLFINGIKFYNNLPENIKNEISKNKFKRYCVNFTKFMLPYCRS